MTDPNTVRVTFTGRALTATGFDDPRVWREAGIIAREDPTHPRRRGYAYTMSVADAQRLLARMENSPALPANGGDAPGSECRSILAAIKRLQAAIERAA